ncbi:TraR/DksA C4-type zinc finger protein [Sulfurimonas sp. HSL-1716]|uniref:TraR/DksA family transcriptional regulator n=1 Tax=Hydrocurvibacter sulfurireducens TaxID=3131937 RepID=UPI0031F8096F
MTTSQKEQIKENIVEHIASLENEITELQEKIKPIAPDCSLGDLTRFEMMHEQDVFHKALRNSQTRLNRLKHILGTIDGDDEYGSCAECGEDILFERLLLLPEAKHCTDCASDR